MSTAPLLEVFASIQGEGAYVGEAQVFLRLRGCPLRCRWCDTPGSWRVGFGDQARVDTQEGSELRDGWASPFQAALWVRECEPREPRTVSVTGGEPLMWPAFLEELPSVMGGRRLHLETAGAHPETLERVLEVFDHVSLDLKLPVDMDTPVELGPQLGAATQGLEGPAPPLTTETSPRTSLDWTLARRRSLELLAGENEVDGAAKVILTGGRAVADYAPLLEDVASIAPHLPLYLQPVTPRNGVAAPSLELLEDVLEDARDLGLQVRVVPQIHPTLGLP